jgi:hypothetical protein
MQTSTIASLLGLALLSSCIKAPYDVAARYPVDASRRDYVDFHNHITMKPYYTQVTTAAQVRAQSFAADSMTAWTLNTPGEKNLRGNGMMSDFSKYRQSDWSTLSKYRFVCTSLYEFERGFAFDRDKRQQRLKRFAISVGSHMPKARKQNILYDRTVTPFLELNAEYAFLKQQSAYGPDQPAYKRISLAQQAADITTPQPNQTQVVLSIEGGHVLFDEQVLTRTAQYPYSRLLIGNTEQKDREAIDRNIDFIKNRWEHPVMFITLSHMIWNKLLGQGKATDSDIFYVKGLLRWLARRESFREAVFTKNTSGIAGVSPLTNQLTGAAPNTAYDNGCVSATYTDPNQLGLFAIQKLLDTSNGHRILIDLRHSTVKARLEYYTLLGKINDSLKAAEKKTIPILMSHSAASGKSLRLALLTGTRPYDDMYEETDNPDKFYKAHFMLPNGSPRLINEYCSVNPGILFPMAANPVFNHYFKKQNGAVNATTHITPDDLPGADSKGWFIPVSNNLADEEVDIICRSNGIIGITLEQRVLGGSMIAYRKKEYGGVHCNQEIMKELRRRIAAGTIRPRVDNDQYMARFIAVAPFVRNLVHLVMAASPDVKVWEHLAIGSDFDGIIDPIDYFHTSDRLPELEQFLYDNLEIYCQLYGWDIDALLCGNDKQQALRQLFSTNGIRFIQEYHPSVAQ